MKRIAALLSALCICLMTLAACGGEASVSRPFAAADLTAVLSGEVFSEELEAVDAELLCMLYGLDESAVTDCAGYLSTGATAEELVFFAAADGQTAAVEAACKQRLEEQKAGYADYIPGEVAKLENALVLTRENTVLLIVPADAAAAKTAVDGLK